jgi:hypothetical protein
MVYQFSMMMDILPGLKFGNIDTLSRIFRNWVNYVYSVSRESNSKLKNYKYTEHFFILNQIIKFETISIGRNSTPTDKWFESKEDVIHSLFNMLGDARFVSAEFIHNTDIPTKITDPDIADIHSELVTQKILTINYYSMGESWGDF